LKGACLILAYLAATSISVQINLMEYRGVRYAIRIGIKRGEWQLAIYLPNKELPEERPVVGTRQAAESAACSIIDAWMKKQFRKLQAR
jgi:hypothetical protein